MKYHQMTPMNRFRRLTERLGATRGWELLRANTTVHLLYREREWFKKRALEQNVSMSEVALRAWIEQFGEPPDDWVPPHPLGPIRPD